MGLGFLGTARVRTRMQNAGLIYMNMRARRGLQGAMLSFDHRLQELLKDYSINTARLGHD